MCKNNTIPDYLYHYTNVETLALILRNRSIRFTPLFKLDDPQEKESVDNGELLGHFVFVSCWTSEAEESVPMWKLYGSLPSGVRICLPSNPFDFSEWPSSNCIAIQFAKLEGDPAKMLFPVKFLDDRRVMPRTSADFPDFKELAPTTATLLGNSKSDYWDFQGEWRYKLVVNAADPLSIRIKEGDTDSLPLKILRDSSEHIYNPLKNFKQMLEDDALAAAGVPEKLRMPRHIDLAISEDALAEMRITLSPAISAGNKVIVEDLVEKYLGEQCRPSSEGVIKDSDIRCVW